MEVKGATLAAHVARVMRTEGLAAPGETVLVAVSGGADSVALLLVLEALQAALDITVVAAHYEHGIRGEASMADAAFVRALCASRGIPCEIGHGDVPALARSQRCSLEDAARRARYAFLEAAAAAMRADVIALAHQLEDQAETLLLHLVHGAGLRGLSAMCMRQGNRIRPLLAVPRAALEDFLRLQGVAWREDATNADTRHARNLLRHEVFPKLRQLNPRVAEAMARTASLAGGATDRLEAQAAAMLAGRTKQMPYGVFWAPGPEGMVPEAARRFAAEAGVPELDARQTAELLALEPNGTINLPGGWRALRTRTRLHLLRAEKAGIPPPDARGLTCEDVRPGEMGDGIRSQALDADRLAGAVLRTRQDGDVFAPIGMQGTQKLKETLQSAGIDRPFRDLLPVLAIGERVLWIIGVKAGRDAAVGPDTRRAVRYVYHGELPWEIP